MKKTFKHNPKVKCEPNGGQYLQIMLGKVLHNQMIIISVKQNDTFNNNDSFLANFQNIFIDYPLDEMRTIDTKWKYWNTTPLRLWQTQLNYNYRQQRFVHQALVGLVLSIWITKSIPWLGCCIDFTCITTWGKFWKDYRFHCPMSQDSMQLIIFTVVRGSSSCAKTMELLMIPWGTEMRSPLGPISTGVGRIT